MASAFRRSTPKQLFQRIVWNYEIIIFLKKLFSCLSFPVIDFMYGFAIFVLIGKKISLRKYPPFNKVLSSKQILIIEVF